MQNGSVIEATDKNVTKDEYLLRIHKNVVFLPRTATFLGFSYYTQYTNINF